MQLIKSLTVLGILLMASSAGAADWVCRGQCELMCESGNSQLEVSGRASSQGSALGQARQQCKELWYQNASRCSSYLPWVSEHDCRELAPPPPKHYTLLFKNNCRRYGQIATAVHFRDLSGNWVSNGFWVLAFGETATVGHTTNRNYYMHGHTEAGQSWGDGEGPWTVRGASYKFGKVSIPDNTPYGSYTFSFNCN